VAEEAERKKREEESRRQLESKLAEQSKQQAKIVGFQAYAQVLKVAWTDGVVSAEEEAILSTLRTSFGISSEEHDGLEQEIQLEVYLGTIADAWQDGHITPEDSERLDGLRDKFKISAEEHLRLEKQVRAEILKQRA
jgi:hypothetical protein